jgi:capsular exopolysaccharide synthesis family protein
LALIRFARLLGRWAWMIALCGIVAAAAAGIISFILPPVYEADSSILIPAQWFGPATGSTAQTGDQVVLTYAQLITEPPLLDQVNSHLQLHLTTENLTTLVRATPRPNTAIIDVTADASNPAQARDIANTLVGDFIAKVKVIRQQESAGSAPAGGSVVVLAPAVTPIRPISPNLPLNTLVGFVLGLLVALALAFGIEYVDQTIRTDDDLTLRVGAVPIAHLPLTEAADPKWGELARIQAEPRTAEQFRTLRTNIIFSGGDRPSRTIVVTSAFPGEGRSRTAAGLAVVLADAGHKTLLLDADFRRPSQHRMFGVQPNLGVTNLILKDHPESECVLAAEGFPNLWVSPSGPPSPNPSEMLGSERMGELLDRFAQHFAYVIIDTPPVIVVTDALILAARSDATLLVAEQGRTTIPGLRQTREAVERVGGRIAGVVVNKSRYEDFRHPNYVTSDQAEASTDDARGEADVEAAAEVVVPAKP